MLRDVFFIVFCSNCELRGRIYDSLSMGIAERLSSEMIENDLSRIFLSFLVEEEQKQ